MSRLRVLALAVPAAVLAALLVPGTAAHAGTQVSWSGQGDDSSWSDPANWSTGTVPGAGDIVTIKAPSDDLCHAHVTDVPDGVTLAALIVDERAFHNDPNSPCLTSISGGSISVTQAFAFTDGTVDTAITVLPGASAGITPGFASDSTHLSQALVVEGTLTMTANTGIHNLSLSGSPGITIAPGGTLNTTVDNDVRADCCLSPAHLTNNGTMNLGSGTLHLDAVELDQNALLTAGSGAQVVTDFAPQTAGPGARWKGAGAWNMQFGTITASGTQTLSGGFHWILGGNGSTSQEHLQGTFTLAGTGEFDWDGGEIDAAMTIGHRVTAIADGVEGADHRAIDGTDDSTDPPTPMSVVLHGSLAIRNGATYHGVAGSRLVVAADGALNLAPGTSLDADCCNAPSIIVNSGGHLTVPPGTGAVTLSNIGYKATGGTTTIGNGTSLELDGGSTGLLSSTLVTGLGTLANSAPLTLTGTSTIDSGTTLTLFGASAVTSSGSATATLTGGGILNWNGGSLSGKIALTNKRQAIAGTSHRVVVPTGKTSSTVTFAGPTAIASGSAAAGADSIASDAGGALVFTGVLTVGTRINCAAAVTTTGTTTVNSSTANPADFASITNSGSLTLAAGTLQVDGDYVQTGGSTDLGSGHTLTLGNSGQVRLQGGTLSGTSLISGTLNNSGGTVAPGISGTASLRVSGDYLSSAAAILSIDVSSSQNALLRVDGTATVAGTLVANDLGGYIPATGTKVTVVTGSSVVTTLSCVRTTGDSTHHWTAAVAGGTALKLTSVDGESPC